MLLTLSGRGEARQSVSRLDRQTRTDRQTKRNECGCTSFLGRCNCPLSAAPFPPIHSTLLLPPGHDMKAILASIGPCSGCGRCRRRRLDTCFTFRPLSCLDCCSRARRLCKIIISLPRPLLTWPMDYSCSLHLVATRFPLSFVLGLAGTPYSDSTAITFPLWQH